MYRAARRDVELDSLLSRFRTVLERAIETVVSFEEAFGSGTVITRDEVQRRLVECEYATFDVVNYLYTVNEITDQITDRFPSVDLGSVRPLNESHPELLGLRNAICHNGLLGMNVAARANRVDVSLSLANVETYAKWNGVRGPGMFERWFGNVDADASIIKRLLLGAEPPTEAVVRRLREQLQTECGGRRFDRFVDAHPLYRRFE